MTLVWFALALLSVAVLLSFGSLCLPFAFCVHYAVFRARSCTPPGSRPDPPPPRRRRSLSVRRGRDGLALVEHSSRSKMDSPTSTSTVLIEDITIPSMLNSFSTSSSVEFTSSDSESETTRMLPNPKLSLSNKYSNNGPTKSYSLVDLSSIKSFKPLLREDSAIYSTETLTSAMTTRTGIIDSGIQRSNSCTTVKNKKYAHVESKVKKYIKDIKENEAKSKAKRFSLQVPVLRKPVEEKTLDEIIQSKDEEIMLLKKTLKKQEIQLLEKNRIIEQLDYNYRLMEEKYNSATNIILRLAKPSRDVLKFTKHELVEQLSPGLSIPPPNESWGHGNKLQLSNTLVDIKKENNSEKDFVVRRVKSGCDLLRNSQRYSNVDAYKRSSRSAIHKVELWQKSLPSTDVSEIPSEHDEELQSPPSYSASSNDVSLGSAEIIPVIRNKNPHIQECHSDSSGCGMSSTRVSKENTLVSGINMSVNDKKLLCRASKMVELYSSTPRKNSGHDLYSNRTKDPPVMSNKQNNESPRLKRRLSKKYRRTKSMSDSNFHVMDTDECISQFQHAIGAINGVVTQMEESLTSHR